MEGKFESACGLFSWWLSQACYSMATAEGKSRETLGEAQVIIPT